MTQDPLCFHLNTKQCWDLLRAFVHGVQHRATMLHVVVSMLRAFARGLTLLLDLASTRKKRKSTKRTASTLQEHENKGTLLVAKDKIAIKNLIEFAVENTQRKEKDDGFYIMDMERTISLYNMWCNLLPRVRPFYAVKCNPDPVFVRQLYMLGTGFDCASKGEIELALDVGVQPKDIIYANPCKKLSHLSFAAQQGIAKMTFDSKEELMKIADIYPSAKILIRFAPRVNNALYDVNTFKFGAPFEGCIDILTTAKDLGLSVVGVSFHVGTSCFNEVCFEDCIYVSRQIFDQAEKLGFCFTILDIGGGFLGKETEIPFFSKMCNVINRNLDKHFPVSSGITIIAEPGTYFACSPFTLATNIIAVKEVDRKLFKDVAEPPVKFTDDSPEKGFMYLVDDGIFGSFSTLLFHEDAFLEPHSLKTGSNQLYPSCIWGQSLYSNDVINKHGVQLPKLFVNDWLYFTEFGAYSSALASNFNGFAGASKQTYYYITMETWQKMRWKSDDFKANILFIESEEK